MRRLFSLLIFWAVLVVTLCFTTSYALAVQTEDIERTCIQNSATYYEYDHATKTLTLSGAGAVPDFTNSSNSATSQAWFRWRADGSIDRVVVEEGITSLGNYCLYGVTAREIILPDSLERLSSFSLAANERLEHINLKNVKVLSNNVFYCCSDLEDITIPRVTTYIGSSCFEGCTSLSSVTFRNMSARVSILSRAFLGCRRLDRVDIPRYATLGAYSFGYSSASAGSIYESFSIGVFRDSQAYTYSENNNLILARRLLDSITIYQGEEVSGTYYDDNISEVFYYYFTPTADCEYLFFSAGDVDLDCTLTDSDNNIIAIASDNSDTDLNFTIRLVLTAGERYCFAVRSVNSIGEYTLCIMPTGFLGVGIDWDLRMNAALVVGRQVDIENIINDLSVDFYFESGYVYHMPFSEGASYMNMTLHYGGQLNNTLSCGDNYDYITVGDEVLEFNIFVVHSYEEFIFEPTIALKGFTRHVCVLCGDSYLTDYVDKLGQDVYGYLRILEAPGGEAIEGSAVACSSIYDSNGRWLDDTDENGYFYILNAYDKLIFESPFGPQREVEIVKGTENLGTIEIVCCDFNNDGYVNAKDLALLSTAFGMESEGEYTIQSIDLNKNGIVDYGDWEYAQPFLAYGRLDENVYK